MKNLLTDSIIDFEAQTKVQEFGWTVRAQAAQVALELMASW